MATVPLVAWRVAVKWFPDNGTPEERERGRKRMRPAERRAGGRREEEMSAGAGKDKERMGESRDDDADLHFSD